MTDWSGGKGADGIVIVRFSPSWKDTAQKQQGGEITHTNGYWIHTFTEGGTLTVDRPLIADILVVGGGGAGGFRGNTGGGGGGGVIVTNSFHLLPGEYAVVVGAGGVSANAMNVPDCDGGPSSVAGLVAYGGGGGGNSNLGGRQGGSGGGASGAPTRSYSGGTGTAGQGHDGGSSTAGRDISSDRTNWNSCFGGGGGGGAGAPGQDSYVVDKGTYDILHPGDGGDGVQCDFSGEAKWYGGGGGGGAQNWGGGLAAVSTSGGRGGGGYGTGYNSGTNDNWKPGDGEPGTGGGGGGAGGMGNNVRPGDSPGGSGGSGIVIIRYLMQQDGTMLLLK